MRGTKADLIEYRISRAKETFKDARLLANADRWNSTINRLYYSAFYAISALLPSSDLNPATHKGAKTVFSQHFVKKGIVPVRIGKAYSQLFTWRSKGDDADLFDLDEERIQPFFEPVSKLIDLVSNLIGEEE